MSDDIQEPSDEELTEDIPAEVVEPPSNDEAVPAARTLTTFESGGVGEAEEAMEEGANLTVSAKEAERRALEDAMAKFLAGGGRIQQVPAEATARKSKSQEARSGSLGAARSTDADEENDDD
jgi:hypothetical protein